MKLPRVTVTALSVGARQSDRRMSVAVLSSVSGRTRTAHLSQHGSGRQPLCAAVRGRPVPGGEHAAEYAAYAAAEPHEVEYRFARGEAMGELGKAAYREGLRRLEGLTNRGLPLGE